MKSKIELGYPTKEQPVTLAELSATYQQDADSNSDASLQTITISTDDAGAGTYYFIQTDRWAFDSIDELVNTLTDFINRIKL